MSKDVNIQYRPKTYFRPEKLEKYLLSQVKGAVMRNKLKTLLDAGQHSELRHLVDDVAFSVADRKILESIHPMFMGGNYLPDTEEGEVEIARICINSTTFDVTSVFARPGEGCIHYRVVDEYGGSTLRDPAEGTTAEPMSLGEFADFFLTAWPLIDVLEMNFEGDLESALEFFSADSDFYPGLDSLCRQRVRDYFPMPELGDECPFCDHLNAPGAGNTCDHACGWVWDGKFEALGDGKPFAAALESLAAVVESAREGSAVKAMLNVHAERSLERARLLEATSLPVEDAMATLANAESASGWSTNGMSGGSGYTICVQDQKTLGRLINECHAILGACSLEIQTKDAKGASLESRRPTGSVNWQLVASGFWSEDMYHGGHIEYVVANPRPSEWILDGVVRKAILDGVTEEDVEEGRLNDDQAQAMWGITLEEAQRAEYRHVVAYCSNASPDLSAKEMASVLYRAVCENGGNEITEPDDVAGLLDV